MTGLFLKDGRGAGADEADADRPPLHLQDPVDRYEEMKKSASAFVINQYGLSAFIWSAESARFEAKTFNFYCFPRPFEDWQPRFVSEAGALEFLADCNFDFNKWIRDGISFLPLSKRDFKIRDLSRRRDRPDIALVKQEDIDFVNRVIDDVTGWLTAEDSRALVLRSVNSYQRALQYQTLRNNQFGVSEPPGFLIERTEDESGQPALLLRRASKAESDAWEEQQQQKRLNEINEATGLSHVLELMRDSGKPAVGHNLAFDVAYSLSSFVRQPLPADWIDYKDLVQRWFPGGIFDTKHMAKHLPIDCLKETSLGYLYRTFSSPTCMEAMSTRERLATSLRLPANHELDLIKSVAQSITHAEGFERYTDAYGQPLYAHEAGFDAFMTGAVFVHLCSLLTATGENCPSESPEEVVGLANPMSSMKMDDSFSTNAMLESVQNFRWKINLTNSDLGHIMLKGPDVLPERDHVLLVSSLPAASITRYSDVVKAISEVDAELGPIRIYLLRSSRCNDGDDAEGLEALLEFSTSDIAMGPGSKALRSAFPACVIYPFSKLRSRREEKRSKMLEACQLSHVGLKRPRSVIQAQSMEKYSPPGRVSTIERRCTIM